MSTNARFQLQPLSHQEAHSTHGGLCLMPAGLDLWFSPRFAPQLPFPATTPSPDALRWLERAEIPSW